MAIALSGETLVLATKGELNALHKCVTESKHEAIVNAVKAGDILRQWKDDLPHGQYGDHVERYFDGSERTARIYVSASETWEAMPKAEQKSFLKGDDCSIKSLLPPPKSKKTAIVADLTSGGNGHQTAGNSNASTEVDATRVSGSGGDGVALTPPSIPAAGDESEQERASTDTDDSTDGGAGVVPDEPCPNCGLIDWDEDDEGWACSKCSHPFGEPAGDIGKDQLVKMRKALVSYLEHAMRQADDINDRTRFAGHEEMIEWLSACIVTAKGIKA